MSFPYTTKDKCRFERFGCIMTRILDITSDGVIFETKLTKRGVPTISIKTRNIADKIAKKIGCAIARIEGNFDETTFYFNREITEVEAELLTNIFGQYFI